MRKTELILVVDDAPTDLEVVSEFLHDAGFEVATAINGERALKQVQYCLPDLILLDVVMPEVDGFEICRRLKAKEETQDIPIIFITVLSDEVDRLRGLTLGAVDYITKPFQQEEVLARVNVHLKLRRLNITLEQQVQERTAKLQQALQFEALLKRITDKVRDSLDERQILQTAVQELGRGLKANYCDTEIYDQQRISVTHYEYGTQTYSKPKRLIAVSDIPEAHRILCLGSCFQFCQTVSSSYSSTQNQQSTLVCPIIDDQELIGDLWLFRHAEEWFDESEIRLVEQVANQCAIAIRQARLYRVAQTQVQELERLNRLKDDFLDTISHELRTPVTNIKLAAQMLGIRLRQPGASSADPAITQYLQILQNECDREMQLVNDLLDLSRLEIEAESLVLNSIVLQNWLPQLIEGFSERIERQQQRLDLRIPSNLPPVVSDLAILERVFTELLNNACKYTPPGEQIQITAQATSAEMQISVSNSGVTLPKAEQTRIFDKFYRIPNADPYKHGGTGLGLALVKRLVQLLCSTIRVESAANQTTFTVTLPLSLE